MADLASLESGSSLFAESAKAKLDRLSGELGALAQRYDIVAANPPYMGSSNMNKWLCAWVKDHYPNSYRDLCTCFIDRGGLLSSENGLIACITSDTCMYLSSFEVFRKSIIEQLTITAFIDTRGTNAHPDVFDANAGWVLTNASHPRYCGAYAKLNQPIGEKRARLLEAIANPDCGWFYRRCAADFKDIPGSPIAYWASEAMLRAFDKGSNLKDIGYPRVGIQTGCNERFLRMWWEVSRSNSKYDSENVESSIISKSRWFPYNKGGEYRKWYGNNEFVINWFNDGEEVIGMAADDGRKVMTLPSSIKFRPAVTWSKISSGSIAFRYKPCGHLFDVAGTSIFGDETKLEYLQGLCNSSVILGIAQLLSPTLNFEVGQISTYPVIDSLENRDHVCSLVLDEREVSKRDYDSFETSWDFKRHPLV